MQATHTRGLLASLGEGAAGSLWGSKGRLAGGERAGSHGAVSGCCCSKCPHLSWLKITPTFYLMALEVRSLTWVSLGQNQGAGRNREPPGRPWGRLCALALSSVPRAYRWPFLYRQSQQGGRGAPRSEALWLSHCPASLLSSCRAFCDHPRPSRVTQDHLPKSRPCDEQP